MRVFVFGVSKLSMQHSGCMLSQNCGGDGNVMGRG